MSKKNALQRYGPWISLAIIIGIIIFIVNIDRIFDIQLPAPEYLRDQVSSPALDISNFQNNPNGILIEEYSDYQCPFCRQAYPMLKQILLMHNGKINYVHHHMPLSYHQYAQKAAEASECARDQGKFMEYHDILFSASSLAVDDLKRYAMQLGLDTAKFNDCLDNSMKEDIVAADFNDAINKGVTGTPTFAVNGKFAYLDEIEAMINAYSD